MWSLAIAISIQTACISIFFGAGYFHKNNYLQDMQDFLIQWYCASYFWWFRFVTGSLWNIFFPCHAFINEVIQIQENLPYMDFHFQSMDYPIGNGYILMLADALKENTSISCLGLSHQMYNGHAVEYLSNIIGVQNLTINHLILSNNDIGNQGAVALANLISQTNCPLQHLHVANGWMTSMGSDAIVQALFTNTSLLTLDLSGNNMFNGKLLGAALKKHAILEHLILNDSCLGDVGVQDLLAAVRDNQALIKLDLGGNRMGVLGVMAIVPILPQLTSLSIPNNWFGDAGAKLLADNLKDNTSLIFLTCYLCSLTSVGKQSLLECLRENTTMRLMIWDCFMEITNKRLIKERDALLQQNRNLIGKKCI
jgi:Ran GTPase-activating protein (RanGAP) involved in mRNA processing and transport